MEALGKLALFLLVVVLALAAWTLGSNLLSRPAAVSVSAPPVAQNPVDRPAEQPPPVVVEPTPTTATDGADSGHGCTASPDNAHGGSPQLTVNAGHRLSVQWYTGEPQQQSVLEEGVYQPRSGVKVGAYWDYPDCPRETVESQAISSNGSIT